MRIKKDKDKKEDKMKMLTEKKPALNRKPQKITKIKSFMLVKYSY